MAGSRPTLVSAEKRPPMPGMMVEQGNAVRLEQRAQAVGLARDARAR